MEKYLQMIGAGAGGAKSKSVELGLQCSKDIKSSWTKLLKDTINVDKRGQMNVLRTRGDGNCLFRSIGIAITGLDSDLNQQILRQLAVTTFVDNFSAERIRRSAILTHHPSDCITKEICEKKKLHSGAILRSSREPFKSVVYDQNKYKATIEKQYVWGNEVLVECLAKALHLKINVVEPVVNKEMAERRYHVTTQNNLESDKELFVLYSVDAGHFETLIPKNLNSTVGDPLQLGSDSEHSSSVDVSSDEDSIPLSSRINGRRAQVKKKTQVNLDQKKKESVLEDSSCKQKSSRNIFPNLDSISIRKKVQGGKQQSIDSMFKAYMKQTLDEVKDNKLPDEMLDEVKDNKLPADEKLKGNLEEQTVDEEKGKKPPGENIEGYGEFEEKNNNESDSYFPYYSDSDDRIDAGDCEKTSNMGVNKRKLHEKLNPEKKRRKFNTASPKERRYSKVCDSWFSLKASDFDPNGHKVNSYLRRVPNDPYKVSCCACDWSFCVKYKGKSAITDHAKGKRHQENMKVLNDNKQIGTYVEKDKDKSVVDAEIGIARFAASHGISLVVIPHLVKLIKAIFPDSNIAQKMGGLSKSRMRYGMIAGLAKTELNQTMKEMTENPFSIQLDGGLKGGRHREAFLSRYYHPEYEQVVDRFILAKTLNVENATLVANTFLDWASENKIPISSNCIMANSDHASTLRGKKTGALKRIGEKAPNIIDCDIGGDILHDLNNSCKEAFYRTFPNLVKFLNITKQDLNKSAKKTEVFTEICAKHGLPTTKPVKWCTSRFLSRKDCLEERSKRLAAYKEFYASDQPPKIMKKKNLTVGDSLQLSSEESSDEDSESDDEESGAGKRKSKSKKLAWLKKKLGAEADLLAVELQLAIECISSSDTLLRAFQSSKPMIHVLKASLIDFTRDCFLEITQSKNLKRSDEVPLGGTSLKELKFETREERNERKVKDKNNETEIKKLKRKEEELEENFDSCEDAMFKIDLSKEMKKLQKEKKKMESKMSGGRYALLYEVDQITLSKDVKMTISELAKNSEEKYELETMAKEKKLEFHHRLALGLQKRFPLDNNLLTNLSYIDPALVFNEKTESAFKKIAEKMSNFIKEEEVDSIVSDIRRLQMNKEDLGKDFKKYCEQKKDDKILFKDLMRIDKVWSPVIKSKKYCHLAKLLKACLSFVHSTAGAEGSIRDLRFILGDFRHSSTDEVVTARLAVLSAIRSCKESKCCFDYKQNEMEHRRNWTRSWKSQDPKSKGVNSDCNEESVTEDESSEDED